MNKIICGDALTVLREMPGESVNTCISSPPYFGLRDYSCAGQVGLEDTPEQYIGRLTEIFREVRRVLKPDGTAWINIGDSYAGSGKGAWDSESLRRVKNKQSYKYTTDNPAAKMPKTWENIKPKDMLCIPLLFALALRNDGWWLRSDVIWAKPNAMPNSVKDRPTSSYEHIFLFAKSRKYYYDYESVKEPTTAAAVERTVDLPATRALRDVWHIPTKPYKGAHFAVFPVELVTPCLIAGCPPGGVVLDPFFGSGTTGVAALRNGRNYIGIDLNPDYCALARERISNHSVIAQTERGDFYGETF